MRTLFNMLFSNYNSAPGTLSQTQDILYRTQRRVSTPFSEKNRKILNVFFGGIYRSENFRFRRNE